MTRTNELPTKGKDKSVNTTLMQLAIWRAFGYTPRRIEGAYDLLAWVTRPMDERLRLTNRRLVIHEPSKKELQS